VLGPMILSAVALWASGKPVQVEISPNAAGSMAGTAFVGTPAIIFLGRDAALDVRRGGGIGLFILLHESAHSRGISNECKADEFGLRMVRPALRRFWPRLTRRQVNQRYADAVAWPGKYAAMGDC
jgi:hypothetical protein